MTPMPILREKQTAVHEVGAPFGTPLLYVSPQSNADLSAVLLRRASRVGS